MQLATKARTFALLTTAVGAACAAPSVAEATERQWFFGGSVGYAFIEETFYWWDGGFVAAEMRYGITDAIDFTTTLDLGFYPDAEQLVPSVHAGLAYVLDISRFLPHVGVTLGLSDVVTYGCPEGFRPCGNELYPVVGIPAGFDFRVTKHLSVGSHFRYGFMLLGGDATAQLTIGGSIAFSTFPGDPTGPSTIPPRRSTPPAPPPTKPAEQPASGTPDQTGASVK